MRVRGMFCVLIKILWLIPIKATATGHFVVDDKAIGDEIGGRRGMRTVVLTRKGKAWLVHLS